VISWATDVDRDMSPSPPLSRALTHRPAAQPGRESRPRTEPMCVLGGEVTLLKTSTLVLRAADSCYLQLQQQCNANGSASNSKPQNRKCRDASGAQATPCVGPTPGFQQQQQQQQQHWRFIATNSSRAASGAAVHLKRSCAATGAGA
jgi:hypothetical protein